MFRLEEACKEVLEVLTSGGLRCLLDVHVAVPQTSTDDVRICMQNIMNFLRVRGLSEEIAKLIRRWDAVLPAAFRMYAWQWIIDASAKTYCRNRSKANLRQLEHYESELLRSGAKVPLGIWNCMIYARREEPKQCRAVFNKMINEGIQPDVVTYNTLMEGMKSGRERREVLEEMRQAGVEPNVVTYSTLMQGFVDDFDSSSALSVFQNMMQLRIQPNSHALSILFSGLVRGINGDARAGTLQIIDIFTRYLDVKNDRKLLDHFVAGPVLRALASSGSVSDVDAFWSRCQRVLAASRDGWPGAFLSKQMCGLHARSRSSTAGWERLVSLCSSGIGGGGEAAAASSGTVVCNNWQQHGSCHFGEGCRYKDGHSGLPSGGSGNTKYHSAASSHVPRCSVVCKNWEKYGSCHFGDGCRYKEGHAVCGSSSRGGGGVARAAAPLLSETSHSRGVAVVCNSWQLRGSCKFGDECRFKAGHR